MNRLCDRCDKELEPDEEVYELNGHYVCLSCYERYLESCELRGELEEGR